MLAKPSSLVDDVAEVAIWGPPSRGTNRRRGIIFGDQSASSASRDSKLSHPGDALGLAILRARAPLINRSAL